MGGSVLGDTMRIEPIRVSQTGEVRRTAERDAHPRRVHTSTSLEDTSDLLAISSGMAVATREALVEELREAYRSGALRPDPERIADRLLELGFENPRGPRT
jgi:anti-sigma28 factor (negative regulator of flagellin synthesis)